MGRSTHIHTCKGILMRVCVWYFIVKESWLGNQLSLELLEALEEVKKKRGSERVRHCRSHLACRSLISKMLLNKLVETNSNWKLISIRFDAAIIQFRTQRQVNRPTDRWSCGQVSQSVSLIHTHTCALWMMFVCMCRIPPPNRRRIHTNVKMFSQQLKMTKKNHM